jgi:hypothetical protein
MRARLATLRPRRPCVLSGGSRLGGAKQGDAVRVLAQIGALPGTPELRRPDRTLQDGDRA